MCHLYIPKTITIFSIQHALCDALSKLDGIADPRVITSCLVQDGTWDEWHGGGNTKGLVEHQMLGAPHTLFLQRQRTNKRKNFCLQRYSQVAHVKWCSRTRGSCLCDLWCVFLRLHQHRRFAQKQCSHWWRQRPRTESFDGQKVPASSMTFRQRR